MPVFVLMAGFGAFGKIAALGDFVRIHTPKGFASSWGDWLQGAMLRNKENMQAGWDTTYLSAPLWRFSLPAGQAGSAPVIGVWMPSIDRVGRQFPLTLVAAHSSSNLPYLHFSNRAMFETLEAIALDTLQNETPKTDLEAALSEIDLDISCASAFDGQAYAGDIAPEIALAAQALGQPDKAIWSCDLGNVHRLLRCNGLPTMTEFAMLLDPMSPDWPQIPVESTA